MSPKPEAPAALLTIDEAAKILRVRKSFLYEQTRRGKESLVPHTRIGRYVRFVREDLDAWIAAHRLGGTRGQ